MLKTINNSNRRDKYLKLDFIIHSPEFVTGTDNTDGNSQTLIKVEAKTRLHNQLAEHPRSLYLMTSGQASSPVIPIDFEPR